MIDLNKDTIISHLSEETKVCYRIISGNYNYVERTLRKVWNKNFIATIVSINSRWKGVLQAFDNCEKFKDFINTINTSKINNANNYNNTNNENNVNANKHIDTLFLSNGLSATLCAIEGVKLCLKIGKMQKKLLFYDLLNMKFRKINNLQKNFKLSELLNESDSFSTNNTNKLKQAKVLIIGAGGLGSPAALGVAAANVGTIGLLDLDSVEISNLNRQVLHSFSRIGIAKAESAEFALKKIYPHTNSKTYIKELSKDNAEQIFSEYNIIIAAVDNIPTRYLINDKSFLLNIPYSEAGVLGFHGTATTIIPRNGHCYRCIYPDVEIENPDKGVLGPVPGVMGFIQAAESIKVLFEIGKTLKNKILLFDSMEMDFNIIEIQKNPECPTCSNS